MGAPRGRRGAAREGLVWASCVRCGMSDADSARVQHLEEIIASISRSLTDPPQASRNGPELVAPIDAGPDLAPPAPKDADADRDPLSGKLAVALNGSDDGGVTEESDFADLLAHVPRRETDSAQPVSP